MVKYKDFHLNTKAQLSFCKAYKSSPEWSESTWAAKLFKILLQKSFTPLDLWHKEMSRYKTHVATRWRHMSTVGLMLQHKDLIYFFTFIHEFIFILNHRVEDKGELSR